jgi:hypothetical protein
VIRPALLAAGLLGLAGCAQEPVAAAPPRTIAASAPAVDGLWLGLHAVTEHSSPVGHGAALSWTPVSWVIEDGALVQAGGELARYDADILTEWNERDAFDLNRDDLRKELDLMRGAGDIEKLSTRIRQLQARRAVVAAELDAASRTDADEIGIARLQLDDARTEHASAVRRRERLERIAAAGAPVTGAELARAREEEVRTNAAIAAPEVALELASLPAARSTVRRLGLTLADIDAQLGSTPEEGLAAQMRTAQERQARREIDRGRGRSEWRRRQFEERSVVLKDPVIRAKITGTAVLRDSGVRAGTKLEKDASSIFVLSAGGLSAQLGVPERLRPLVSVGSRLALRSPAFPGRPVMGEVFAIAAAPERGLDGVLSFPAQVRLRDPPSGLRPGMSAECQVAVDASAAAALIPSFCVLDPTAPAVVMADGSERPVQGWTVGGWFVALQGLTVGERVRVPAQGVGATGVRLSTLVEPANFTPVMLRSWDWEFLELVPEGTQVRTGDRIARLVKVDHWRSADQIRADADLSANQARLDLAIAQLSATDVRAGAQSAWVRARIERDRARLEAWVTRNAYDAVAQARTGAALATAEVAHERAARELAAAEEERAAGGISENTLRGQRIALDRAAAALARSQLDAAIDSLGPDWLELRRLDNAARSAAEAEQSQQALATIAGETFRTSLASAIDRFNGTRRWIDGSLRNLADEEVVAPADGVLVFNRPDGETPRPGQPVKTWEPFRIADGSSRRATFEVPSRLHGRIAVGSRVRLSGPGLEQPLEADVVNVSSAFMPPASFAEEVALGRTLGAEERVFTITVGFTPDRADQLPPGSTVYVDL